MLNETLASFVALPVPFIGGYADLVSRSPEHAARTLMPFPRDLYGILTL